MTTVAWQFFVTFLGWLSDPFKGLSDLQLGDENVTLNHLVDVHEFCTLLRFAYETVLGKKTQKKVFRIQMVRDLMVMK